MINIYWFKLHFDKAYIYKYIHDSCHVCYVGLEYNLYLIVAQYLYYHLKDIIYNFRSEDSLTRNITTTLTV